MQRVSLNTRPYHHGVASTCMMDDGQLPTAAPRKEMKESVRKAIDHCCQEMGDGSLPDLSFVYKLTPRKVVKRMVDKDISPPKTTWFRMSTTTTTTSSSGNSHQKIATANGGSSYDAQQTTIERLSESIQLHLKELQDQTMTDTNPTSFVAAGAGVALPEILTEDENESEDADADAEMTDDATSTGDDRRATGIRSAPTTPYARRQTRQQRRRQPKRSMSNPHETSTRRSRSTPARDLPRRSTTVPSRIYITMASPQQSNQPTRQSRTRRGSISQSERGCYSNSTPTTGRRSSRMMMMCSSAHDYTTSGRYYFAGRRGEEASPNSVVAYHQSPHRHTSSSSKPTRRSHTIRRQRATHTMDQPDLPKLITSRRGRMDYHDHDDDDDAISIGSSSNDNIDNYP